MTIPTDIADEAQVEAAAAQVEREWGGIDIWVNNAMATIFGPVSSLTGAQIKRATEVTYLGAVYGTLSALKRMRARDRGVIVQVGSALSYRAIPLQAPYCAAKHALRGFTDGLRCELMHDRSNVRLAMVHLSAFNTPQFDWALNLVGKRPMPVPPIFQPELAAEAIVWASRHPRREVFVGWPAVKAVFGNKLVPGYADRKLAKQGYEGQITAEPLPPEACANLYDPCDVDPGSHGRFDAQARNGSAQWWFTTHRRPVAYFAAVLVSMFAVFAWV
jgi:NAD(P)-dependent dehydrogenase (short-subunit alcohol dehydrogenase family)